MKENVEQKEEIIETKKDDNEEAKGHERLFTQEQVNEIVKKRLERNGDVEAREQKVEVKERELKAQENRLICKEHLVDNGYPLELIDIINTENPEEFKEKLEKTANLFKGKYQHRGVPPLAQIDSILDADIGKAFGKQKHEPKKYGY